MEVGAEMEAALLTLCQCYLRETTKSKEPIEVKGPAAKWEVKLFECRE